MTIIRLGYKSLYSSSNLPGFHASHAYISFTEIKLIMKPYLVLLQVEFTLQLLLPAIRCALTAPFQPYLFRKRSSAVFSLLHLSSAHAAQVLPGTLLIGARTFLPFICLPFVETLGTTIKQRLSGQLGAHFTRFEIKVHDNCHVKVMTILSNRLAQSIRH